MFLLRPIIHFFNPSAARKELEREFEELNEVIEKEIEAENYFIPFQRDSNVYEHKEESEKIKEISETDCSKGTGIITQINGDRAVINNVLHFNINHVSTNLLSDLQIGCKVEYLAYKMKCTDDEDDEQIRVRKILNIIEYAFEAPTEEYLDIEASDLQRKQPEYFQKHKHNYLGIVIEKTRFRLIVKSDENISVEMDSVSIDFVPQLGDLVVAHCYVQTDKKFTDTAGEILEVFELTAHRTDSRKCYISEVGDNYGIFEEEQIYFLFDILDGTYKPSAGDLVEIECIENDGAHCNKIVEKCTWRCTKIKILEKKREDQKNNEYDEILASMLSNKNGIEITDNFHIKLSDLNKKKEFCLDVKNNGKMPHKIISWHFKGKKHESQLRLKSPTNNDPIYLDINDVFTFELIAEAKNIGLREEYFEIVFDKQLESEEKIFYQFRIGRKIAVDVGNQSMSDYKVDVIKYSRRGGKTQNRYQCGIIVETMRKRFITPGVAPNIRPRFVENRLGYFAVPERLQDAVWKSNDRKDMEERIEEISHSMAKNLSSNNYVPRFETLLHLEEIEQGIQMRQYDRQRAHFTREGEYLRLNIDNLAEKRPSLVIGDSLQAVPIGTQTNNEKSNEGYQAYIHKVMFDYILVKFNSNFHQKYNGEDYRLYFQFSRSSFRKQHHALLNVKKVFGDEFLFPTRILCKDSPQIDCYLDNENELILSSTKKKFEWFNPKLNYVQKIAIRNVLRAEARPMPYIIFGPPGTGKTMTLIEIILQLVRNCSKSRILVAASSNSAADLLATRLVESNVLVPGDFLRLVGHNAVENNLLPEHLKKYCATVDIAAEGSTKSSTQVTESGLILKCRKSQLLLSRILIGTCMTLGNLLHIKFPRDHFTHAIIDEAGQCLEPEVMVVISQIDSSQGQVILAGDPLQLGPVVINKYAADKGLDVSFVSRLLKTAPYAKDRQRYITNGGYNQNLVTKLIYNYRSLPCILNTFNKLFYDDELQPEIDAETSSEAVLLKSLNISKPDTRQKNFGVIFHGIRGENRQDSDSPSWYNGEECRTLVSFVLKLLNHENISPKNIGIITPYQQQVKKIRVLLEASHLKREFMPKVGSVEEFQGQEKDIILISTVRSSKKLIAKDLKYTLGFVQSEKRMNVAISRAKSLLVIFGNPHLLMLDSNWSQLIKYCHDNDSYTGCDLPSEFEIVPFE